MTPKDPPTIPREHVDELNTAIQLMEDAQDSLDHLLMPMRRCGDAYAPIWVAYNLIRDQIHELMRIHPEHDKAHCWECQDLRENGVQP